VQQSGHFYRRNSVQIRHTEANCGPWELHEGWCNAAQGITTKTHSHAGDWESCRDAGKLTKRTHKRQTNFLQHCEKKSLQTEEHSTKMSSVLVLVLLVMWRRLHLSLHLGRKAVPLPRHCSEKLRARVGIRPKCTTTTGSNLSTMSQGI